LNYDLLIVQIVKLDSAYDVDYEENVIGGVRHIFESYMTSMHIVKSSHMRNVRGDVLLHR